MIIGIPKEIISQEYRVSINPETAKMLLQSSHELYVQSGAGQDSGYNDEDYSSLGCTIVDSASEVFDRSELIVKVKEPSLEEVEMLSNMLAKTGKRNIPKPPLAVTKPAALLLFSFGKCFEIFRNKIGKIYKNFHHKMWKGFQQF